MKLWKRLGAALLAAATLTALTVPALAAEPDGGIAVQLDGKQLSFTDAAPEITSDRTFLPFRAVLEAMGAEVGYDEQTSTVSAKKDGVELSMVPGQTTLTIVEGGQTRTQEMDVAPYINTANDRTYIPVRYAAEAFGYGVGWDQDSKTVILADVDALFGNATFELLDSLAAYSSKQTVENMSLTGSLKLDVNDKTGDLAKPIKIEGSMDGAASEKGVQLAGKLSVAGLEDLPDTPAWVKQLSNASAELRVDLENKTLYISLPSALTGGTENIWYSLDLSAYEAQLLGMMDLSQIAQLEDASFRESLVWVMKSLPLTDSASSYAALKEMADLYVTMFSDQAFTKDGDKYVAKISQEELGEMEIALTKKGEDVTAMDFVMNIADETSKANMTMHASPTKMDMSMNMTVTDSEMDLSIQMEMNCAPTDKAPQIQPPAGTQVLPLA